MEETLETKYSPWATRLVTSEGPMPEKRLSADVARAKGLCEKCQEKPLSTMHYCKDCMAQIRERKRANLAKRQGTD